MSASEMHAVAVWVRPRLSKHIGNCSVSGAHGCPDSECETHNKLFTLSVKQLATGRRVPAECVGCVLKDVSRRSGTVLDGVFWQADLVTCHNRGATANQMVVSTMIEVSAKKLQKIAKKTVHVYHQT